MNPTASEVPDGTESVASLTAALAGRRRRVVSAAAIALVATAALGMGTVAAMTPDDAEATTVVDGEEIPHDWDGCPACGLG